MQEIKDLITKGQGPEFTEDEQGTLWFKDRICVPNIECLRETVLKEAHDLDYSISSWEYQDVSGFEVEVLVVWTEERCGRTCGYVRWVSKS
jgi:hypothetical protein